MFHKVGQSFEKMLHLYVWLSFSECWEKAISSCLTGLFRVLTNSSIFMFGRVVQDFNKKSSSSFLTGLFRVFAKSHIFLFERVLKGFDKKPHLHVWKGCWEFWQKPLSVWQFYSEIWQKAPSWSLTVFFTIFSKSSIFMFDRVVQTFDNKPHFHVSKCC